MPNDRLACKVLVRPKNLQGAVAANAARKQLGHAYSAGLLSHGECICKLALSDIAPLFFLPFCL